MKLLKALLITLIIILLIRVFAFTSCAIPFSGMENTLYQGENIIVNKWSYGFRIPLTGLFSYHRISERPVKKNDIVVFNDPSPQFTQASIDSKDIFISRCIGIPGDTLLPDKSLKPISPSSISSDYKALYAYPKEREDILLDALKQLDIKNNELIGYQEDNFIRSFSQQEIYLLKQHSNNTIEFTLYLNDSINHIQTIVVPGKGKSIKITSENVNLLKNVILQYERKNADVCDGHLIIDGKEVDSFTFTKDYYWMASDNSINMNDSRSFGFVPKDHIIGKASFIWFSKEKETGLFKGYRWNRFFQSVK